jgi:ribosomal protein S18 acetylase RimI-like enzyme
LEHPLDNPVWHALVGPQAEMAVGDGKARHYPRAIAPFSAISEAAPDAYADLAVELPSGLEARLFRPSEEPPPAGWSVVSARPILQMIAESPGLLGVHPAESRLVPLGLTDAADMLALAEEAKPGPFSVRTPELGHYAGLRAATGRLLAMAGERFRLKGYVELSAISVAPDVRGQGFGAALTLHLARAALARGEAPFLHVFPDNPAAALYARLGFRLRTTLWVLWHHPIASKRGA